MKKLVNVAPGSVRVRVTVANGDSGPTRGEQVVAVAVKKLVYVAPGNVRVIVAVEGGVAGLTKAEQVVTVRVWKLSRVLVIVAPSSVEIDVS